MIKSDELLNEIRYFNYLHSAVYAFKEMLNDENMSFHNSVEKNNVAPRINDIPKSDIILAKSILALSHSRRIMVLDLRERLKYFKFDKIEKDNKFLSIKNILFKDEPDLTKAECKNILKQICNSIAHGDVIESFNFDEYKNGITKIYQKYGTITPKSLIGQDELKSVFSKSCTLKFYYPSYFTFNENGEKIKRPKPVKNTLTLSFENFYTLMIDILGKEDYIHHYPIGYGYLAESNQIITVDGENGEQVLDLTPKQMQAFLEIYNYYSNYLFNNTQNVNLKNFATYTAIQNILLTDKFAYLKLKNIEDSGLIIPEDYIKTKYTGEQLTTEAFIKDCKIYDNNLEAFRAIYANGNLQYAYKEFLITQLVSMLELAEQNQLFPKIAECETIGKLACDLSKVENTEALKGNERKEVLKKFRNSFIHGYYINNVRDKIEVFDQISDTDETLEYKFTASISDLEKLSQKCIETLKEYSKELKNKENSNTNCLRENEKVK